MNFDEIMAAKPASTSPPAQGSPMAFEDIMAMKPTPATVEDPDNWDFAHDVGVAGKKGAAKGNELLMDIAVAPISGGQRLSNAYQGLMAELPPGQDGLWDRIMSVGKGLLAPTDIGRATAQIRRLATPPDTDYRIPKGDNPVLDRVRTATRLGAEFLSAAPLAGVKNIGLGVETAMGAAIGGTVGREVGGDEGEVAGSIIGGLGRDIIPAVKGAGRLGARAGKKAYSYRPRKGAPNLDKTSDVELKGAVQDILKNANPADAQDSKYLDTLVKTITDKVAKGEKGSVGQLTGDRGILSLERTAIADPVVGRKVQQAQELIDAKIQRTVDDAQAGIAPTGVARRALGPVKSRLKRSRAQMAKRTQATADRPVAAAGREIEVQTARSTQAAKPLTDVGLPTEESVFLYNVTRADEQAKKAAIDQAWDSMRGGKPGAAKTVPGEGVKQKVDQFVDGLNTTDARLLKRHFNTTLEDVGALGSEVDIDEISSLISEITRITGGMQGVSLPTAGKLKDVLYEAMTPATGSAQARREAANVTREYHQQYGKKAPLGKALNTKRKSFGKAVLPAGEGGADKADDLLNTGSNAIANQSEKYFRSVFKQNAFDLTTGKLSRSSAAGFRKQYADQLETFPALRDEIDSLLKSQVPLESAQAGASAAVSQAVKARAQGKQRASALSKTITARTASFGKEKVTDAVAQVMKSKHPVNDIKELTNATRGNPQGREDLRRAFMDSFVNSTTKDGQMTVQALDSFRAQRSTYADSKLFSKTELDTVQGAMEQGQKMFMRNPKQLAALPPESQRLAETLGALAGAKVGQAILGSPLIGAGIGRKVVLKAVKAATSERVKQLSYMLTTRPDKFADILAKMKDKNLTNKQLNDQLKRLFTRLPTIVGGVIAGTRQED